MFVSADQKSLLWAVYDYSEYDITATRLEPTQIKIGFVMGGSDHTFMGKRKMMMTRIAIGKNRFNQQYSISIASLR
jgi:hypothetical protein